MVSAQESVNLHITITASISMADSRGALTSRLKANLEDPK